MTTNPEDRIIQFSPNPCPDKFRIKIRHRNKSEEVIPLLGWALIETAGERCDALPNQWLEPIGLMDGKAMTQNYANDMVANFVCWEVEES